MTETRENPLRTAVEQQDHTRPNSPLHTQMPAQSSSAATATHHSASSAHQQQASNNSSAVQVLFRRIEREIEEKGPPNTIHFIVDFLCKHYAEHLHGFASVWNSDPELEKERQEVVLFFKHHKISTQISAHFTNAGYDTLETVATLTTDTLVDIETFNSVKWLPGHKVRLQQVFSDIGERVREFRQRQPPYGYQQSSYMASPGMASPQEMQQMQLRQQYAMQMAAQQQALAQLQQQQAALTNMSSTTTSASPLVGTTPTVTTTVSPGIAGGAVPASTGATLPAGFSSGFSIPGISIPTATRVQLQSVGSSGAVPTVITSSSAGGPTTSSSAPGQ